MTSEYDLNKTGNTVDSYCLLRTPLIKHIKILRNNVYKYDMKKKNFLVTSKRKKYSLC